MHDHQERVVISPLFSFHHMPSRYPHFITKAASPMRIARENEMRMHWMATGFVVAISIACLGGLGDCARAQDAAQKLTGIAAWNQLVGNSITGKEDGETLVEYYAPDGTAKSMRGNEISTGHWALVGETICFRYADEKEMECYRVDVMGTTVTFTDKSGTGSRYEILKGNPKNL